MAEFTKGEWKVWHPVNNDYTIYTGEYGQGITQVAIISECHPNAEANAHLIAAAPKMYEALRDMLQGSELDPDNPKRVWDRAMPSSKAIIKAFEALKLAKGLALNETEGKG